MKLEAYETLARRRADEVLSELGIAAPPVDPEAVAAERGILIEEWPGFPADCFGALILSDSRFRIAVSSSCPTRGHRRFTIAHELGHYHIEGHVDALLSTGNGTHLSFGSNFRKRKDPYEVEADAFASELLVPHRFAAPLIQGGRPGLALVRSIADRFETSLSCAAVRFATLTHHAVAVMISHQRSIEWVAASGPLFDQPWFRRRSWKGEWAPRGSGTYRLSAAPARIDRTDEDGSTGLLCEWFESAPDIEVCEEAMGLGRYGRILTVLTCTRLPEPDEYDEFESGLERDWRDALRGYELG